MYKQKINIIIFVGLFVCAAGLALYGFLVNYGTLEITAFAPYTLSVGKETAECPAPKCTLKLTPGVYFASITKEGYEEVRMPVTIKRWRTLEQNVELKFIPVLTKLDKWPEEPSEKQIYFLKDNSVLIGQYPDGISQQITVFPRPFKNPTVLSYGVFTLIYEINDGVMSAYVVNGALKGKWRILEEKGVERAKWAGECVLFEGENHVFAINIYKNTRKDFDIQSLDQIASSVPGWPYMYFFSEPSVIQSYDFINDKYEKVIDVEGALKFPDRITGDENRIIFKTGGSIFELLLAPKIQ